MTDLLLGFKVLITRPANQAANLVQQVTQLGGEAIVFPTIEIADLPDQTLIQATVKKLAEYHLAVFISPNAVRKSMATIKHYWTTWPSQVAVAAIGASTAQALHEAGFPVDVCPTEHFNSEALLALPMLQNMAGKRIVLFRGIGGRELLAATLQARGAQVTDLAIYQRTLPTVSDEASQDLRQAHIIICTSNTGLQNLITLVGAGARTWLQNMPLLVVSARMAARAKELGFIKQPIIAEDATDGAVVSALLRYAREHL